MDGNLTASDVALLSGNNGGFGDANAFMWIFALLILAGGGFGGFGGNNFANAIGYENLATSNEVQRGFDNQNLQAQTRDILSAVTAGTAQTVATVNQAKYDNINVAKDIEGMILSQIGEVKVGQTQALAKQSECCCETLRAIDGVNYNQALNTASINANTTAQTQKILDAMAASKMSDMQNRINQLELAQAMTGVVKYPLATTYTSGGNPFCGCGCGNI